MNGQKQNLSHSEEHCDDPAGVGAGPHRDMMRILRIML